MILTGFSKDGIHLLQNYLDNVGDIQTVALLVSHSPVSVLEESSAMEVANQWIEMFASVQAV